MKITCDCCKVIIGNIEYTIINEYDTQLFICKDCLTIKDINLNNERGSDA